MSMRCCGSKPRCRSCPLVFAQQIRDLKRSTSEPDLPAHLAGVPDCLHKYEPMLRQSVETAGPPPPAA